MLKDKIRQLRKKAGYNQIYLAELMNVSQATIASWENGTRRPDLDALCKLAEVFNCTTDEILERSNPDDSEMWELREQIRRDPKRRILLSFAKNGKDKAIKQTVALIDALKATNPDFYDGDDPS